MVRNLNEYLKIIIEPIVKNPDRIISGRKLPNIGLTPREVLGLFLVCAVGRYISNEEWTLASDPDEGDGIIFCPTGPRAEEGFAVEQVYIPSFETGNLTELALSRIDDKSSKGTEYGKDRHLIIYCDKHDLLDHQKIKQELNTNHIFCSFWLIGKSSQDSWSYFVACPKTTIDPIMAYEVTINNDFDGWAVNPLGSL